MATVIVATWDDSQCVYVCGGWTSIDGRNWLDRNGRAVEGAEFDEATIQLNGGPENGLVVR